MPDNNGLHNLQQAMLRYLQDGTDDIESLVAEQPPLSAQNRLSIYANAYRIRLGEALETDHEMIACYLGDQQFADMAEAYIQKHPSTFRSLRDFGDSLPEFLRQQAPYDELPVLAELATFERLMLDVFDAPDTGRAGIAELQAIPVDSWPDMRIRFHPSMRVHHTETNAVEIWQALKASNTPPEVIESRPSEWLLWRGMDRLSQFRSLPEAEHALLNAAIRGCDFASLCEQLLPYFSEAEISEKVLSYLLAWLEQALIRNFDC